MTEHQELPRRVCGSARAGCSVVPEAASAVTRVPHGAMDRFLVRKRAGELF